MRLAKKVYRIGDIEDIPEETDHRGSHYIGISKNGASAWQVMTGIDHMKTYLGSFTDPIKAA